MTTAGYGDLTPVSNIGRLLTCAWLIVSVVLVSVITSLVCSRLTVDQINASGIDNLSDVRSRLLEVFSAR